VNPCRKKVRPTPKRREPDRVNLSPYRKQL
jgi:hypothetical protein